MPGVKPTPIIRASLELEIIKPFVCGKKTELKKRKRVGLQAAGFLGLSHSKCCRPLCLVRFNKNQIRSQLPTHKALGNLCHADWGKVFFVWQFRGASRSIRRLTWHNCPFAVLFWERQNLNYEHKDLSSSVNFRRSALWVEGGFC